MYRQKRGAGRRSNVGEVTECSNMEMWIHDSITGYKFKSLSLGLNIVCHTIVVWVRNILTIILLSYLSFQPLDVVSRYHVPQSQVIENYSYLYNFRPNIYKY